MVVKFQPVESTSPFKIMVSDVNLHPYNEARGTKASGAGWAGALVAAVPDAHSVERLVGAMLQSAARAGLHWRAAERALRCAVRWCRLNTSG